MCSYQFSAVMQRETKYATATIEFLAVHRITVIKITMYRYATTVVKITVDIVWQATLSCHIVISVCLSPIRTDALHHLTGAGSILCHSCYNYVVYVYDHNIIEKL